MLPQWDFWVSCRQVLSWYGGRAVRSAEAGIEGSSASMFRPFFSAEPPRRRGGAASLSGGDPAQMLELASLAVGDGSALGESGPVIRELLDEGAAVTQNTPWALAMATTLLLTPGVESESRELEAATL